MNRRTAPPSSDSLLVTEQAGLSTTAIGFFLALVLGLMIRGVLAPEKIKDRVSEAASHLGPQFHVTLDKAYVSLSRGFLPDFSVVVKNVHIESQKKCWMAPDAELNEVRFPISIIDALAGRAFFHSVEADTVILLLRNDPSPCDPAQPEASQGAPSRQTAAAKPPAAAGAAPSVTAPDLHFFSVERLKVNYLPLPFTSFEFLDFEIDVKSERPQILHLKTLLNLGGETLSGDYSSHAHIQATFDESAQPQLTSTVGGTWREGHYDMKWDYDVGTHQMNLGGELRHIPLSQVFPVLKKYKLMSSDFKARQAWVSSRFEAHGQKGASFPLTVNDFKVEGDLGEISLAHAKIQKWNPADFEPLQFDLKQVRIDELLNILNRSHPSSALGHLGAFTGKLILKDNQDAQLMGTHSGMELIFSNKGRRQIQEIESMSTALALVAGRWSGQIDKVRLREGVLDGNLKISSDRDWTHLDVKADIKGLELSDRVKKLMTQGGDVSTLTSKIEARLVQGQLRGLNGFLRGEKIDVEGLQFIQPQFEFSSGAETFDIRFSSSQAVIRDSGPLQPLISELAPDLKASAFKKVSVKFKTQALHNFSWNQFQASSENWSLTSSGGWDEGNALFGQISILEKGKTKQWRITGSREKPLFIRE